MALLHLPLLDHAVESTAEALRLLRAEQGRPADKRSAFRIAGALHQAHLALEKLLKYAVAAVDPVLLLADPKPKLLRDVRREMLQQALPSMFASRRSLSSLNADDAWGVLKEVVDPAVDADTAGSFEGALKALTLLRNQAQHGELYADDDEALSVLTRVFSKTPALAAAVAPEFLAALEARHPKQFAELRAIEQATTAAWWAVHERLTKRQNILIPVAIYLTSRPGVPTTELAVAHPSAPGSLFAAALGPGRGPSLSLTAEVEPDAASGLFARPITAEQAKEREAARRAVVRQRLTASTAAPGRPADAGTTADGPADESLQPPLLRVVRRRLGIGALGELSKQPGDALFDSLLAASKQAFERERAYVEQNGLPPLEDGALRLASTPAWVQIPFRADQYLSGDVVLQSLALKLTRTRPRGTLGGRVLPTTLDHERPVTPLKLQGKVWLTNEIVVTELSTSSTDPLPVGTIVRYLRGEVRLLLDSPPA